MPTGAARRGQARRRLSTPVLVPPAAALRHVSGLDAAARSGDVWDAMVPLHRLRPDLPGRILLPALPVPLRRLLGFALLGITLWLASLLALLR